MKNANTSVLNDAILALDQDGKGPLCRELTTLLVARLDEGTELKVADPKEQQGDVEEKETEGEERRDGVDCG